MRTTKTAAIKKALRARARRDVLRALVKLEGKLQWQGDLDALRKRKLDRG